MSRTLLLQGNQAVVEGAVAAGVRFYGGYPITPSTEIAEQLAMRLPQVGGKFMQTEDEIAGLGAAIGASMAVMGTSKVELPPSVDRFSYLVPPSSM